MDQVDSEKKVDTECFFLFQERAPESEVVIMMYDPNAKVSSVQNSR